MTASGSRNYNEEAKVSVIRPSPCDSEDAKANSKSRMKTKQDMECFSREVVNVFKDTTTSARKLASFPQFNRLPAELRCLIWEFALPDAAVVPRIWNNKCFRYNLQRRVPAVLQVCAEARTVLITKPEVSETASPKFSFVHARGYKTGAGVYVNWKTDSIWLYRGYDITHAEVATYANLRSLIMNWGLRPCWVDSAVDDGVRFIRQFPKLQLLTLMVDFSEHGWPEPATLKGLRRLKREEVKRIWGLVQNALKKAQACDAEWQAPSVHIMYRKESSGGAMRPWADARKMAID